MGHRGKLSERQQARQLRRAGLPLAEIASRLGVAKSSVSLWVRDVPFDPLPRPPRAAAAPPKRPAAAPPGRDRPGWSPRAGRGSGGCRSANSWWRGSRCARGRGRSATARSASPIAIRA
ncbi:MAG TPA: helix-turn-helix domain-containing protein [Actinomycetota bacterium]|nr:helix-turn-helix domain-containing protein [Actinomycetota bacterium]